MVTGPELIEELAKRGVDTSRATVRSTNLPEPDGDGGWRLPQPVVKRTIKATADGHHEVSERKIPAYPVRYVVLGGGWHIGPGGYRKSEDFSGWVGVTRPRDLEIHMTDDLDELAEILTGLRALGVGTQP